MKWRFLCHLLMVTLGHAHFIGVIQVQVENSEDVQAEFFYYHNRKIGSDVVGLVYSQLNVIQVGSVMGLG